MDQDTPLPPLRSIEIKRLQQRGEAYLLLRDPLELAGPGHLLLPLVLAPLLAMLDGQHSAARAAALLERRLGAIVAPADLLRLVGQLSEACLLDDARSVAARASALAAYRASPRRALALTPGVYPAEPQTLHRRLRAYGWDQAAEKPADGVLGLISPHIDYHRGGPVYARLWKAARAAARAAEVVVIFGTDHAGGVDRLTLTTQDYATPWGSLPTDRRAYDAIAGALGDAAFADELNHRTEHSIELAAVWLHFARDGVPVPLVPILCGHPAGHMSVGGFDAGTAAKRALTALRGALTGRRVLAVAAADLAHVGPAFGDAARFSTSAKASVRAADNELIAACARGAGAVLESAARINDRYRICGLSPIACLIDLIGPAEAEMVAYDQCPADDDAGSIVSIAGVILRQAGVDGYRMKDG